MKIYVVSAYSKTGGTKTLHQMANKIQNIGYETCIVYYDNGEIIKTHNKLYDWCECDYKDEIEDTSDNIIIAPESMTYALIPLRYIKKTIFWLSLDFYFWTIPHYKVMEKMRLYSYPTFLYPLAYFHLRKTFIKKEIVDIAYFHKLYHIYNCEYVRTFLHNHRVADSNMHYLCGPIEDSFLDIPKDVLINNKRDVISYNVNKDKVVMKQLNKVLKLIKTKNSNIELIPIEKMSREEVEKTLVLSKLFLDLGSFPGPERIPREAVLAYANLLVLNNGSASNDLDYPIPQQYKLSSFNERKIADKAVKMVEQYRTHIDHFDAFRQKVVKQRLDFEKDIIEIFSKDHGFIFEYANRF